MSAAAEHATEHAVNASATRRRHGCVQRLQGLSEQHFVPRAALRGAGGAPLEREVHEANKMFEF